MVLRSVSLAALLATAAAFVPASVVRFCELHGRIRIANEKHFVEV